MRESWIDANDKAIRDDIIAIAKKQTGLTNFKSTGVLRGIIETLAACVFFIYKTAINPICRNATLDGATGIFLSFWGLALGVVRKQDNKAGGNFTGHPYGEGSIPSGAWIADLVGNVYEWLDGLKSVDGRLYFPTDNNCMLAEAHRQFHYR